MEPVKIGKKDLEELLKGFLPYKSKSRLSYSILKGLLDWKEFKRLGAFSYEIPVSFIIPKIRHPKGTPVEPCKNYNQAFDRYLNPASELLYLVGKVRFIFKFHCEADNIVITASLPVSPLKIDIEAMPSERKELLLGLLYKELPITNDFIRKFVNDFGSSAEGKEEGKNEDWEAKEAITQDRKTNTQLENSFKNISALCLELMKREDFAKLRLILSELEEQIINHINDLSKFSKQYELAPSNYTLVAKRNFKKTTQVIRRDISIFLFICYLIITNKKKDFYNILCKLYKDVFQAHNACTNALSHKFHFEVVSLKEIIFVLSYYIGSIALKNKAFEFLLEFFKTNAQIQYTLIDYKDESNYRKTPFKINDSLPGLTHFDYIFCDIISLAGMTKNGYFLPTATEDSLTKSDKIFNNYKLIRERYSPLGENIKYLIFYDMLIMLRFYRDRHCKKINFAIPYYAYMIDTEEKIEKGLGQKIFNEIKQEIDNNFSKYNELLKLPSKKAFIKLVSIKWDKYRKDFEFDYKPRYLNQYEKSLIQIK